MPLPLPDFQRISFAEANPLLTGLQAGQGIAQNFLQMPLDLQQKQLANALTKSQAQWYPATAQADVASKYAYANLAPFQAMANMDPVTRLQYAQQVLIPMIKSGKLNFNSVTDMPGAMPPAPQSNGGGLMGLVNGLLGNNGQNQPASPPQSGSLTNTVPSFQPNQGGGAPSYAPPPAAGGNVPPPANTGGGFNTGATGGAQGDIYDTMRAAQLKNTLNQAGADVRFSKDGKGGTYTNLQTGEQLSIPTQENVTRAQQAALAMPRVEQTLTRLADAQAPFQSGWNEYVNEPLQAALNQWAPEKLKNNAESLLGTKFDLPDKAAKRDAELAAAPEALMRLWQVNITDESTKRMEKTVQPRRGETKQGYKQRILDQLDNLRKEEAGQAESTLQGGIPLSQQQLEQSPQAQNEGIVDVNLSGFKSKKDFQDWYKSQSPSVQAAVRAKLGGK